MQPPTMSAAGAGTPCTPPPPSPFQAVDITYGSKETTARFTYSVHWTPTDTTFENRLQRYERFPLNPIHLEVSCVCM